MLNEPVDLPEDTVVELVPADQGDDLDDKDRARLHAALAAAPKHPRAGSVRDSFPEDCVICKHMRCGAKRREGAVFLPSY